jgi:2-polyprenyl-6-methoxyphenol hydroxylase-like FAD-dependent oxidoreductase
MGSEHRVVIVGAGMAGLTAAAALDRVGVDALVLERMDRLYAFGGGFTLASNALLALREIGLDEQVEQAGVVLEHFAHHTWRGRELARWPIGEFGRKAGAPIVGIGRPELQRIIAGALSSAEIRLGATWTGLSQDERGVTVEVAGSEPETGAALIGADGAESRIRNLFYTEPRRYSGYTTWLASAEFDGYPADTQTQTYGDRSLFGALPIGGGKVYWYASETVPAGGRDTDTKAYLLDLFKGWEEPIPSLIDATDPAGIARHDIADLPRRESWGTGRVTLAGDAAHSMAPALGQGAGQAIEDGVVLARHLAGADDIPAALHAYEAERIDRVAPIAKRAALQGKLMQGDNVAMRVVRDLGLLRFAPKVAISKGFDDVLRFEIRPPSARAAPTARAAPQTPETPTSSGSA